MIQNKKNELGSIMVEVIAVLGLLGVMGTLLFRQVQQRQDELTNVNIATEARLVKDATMAYIQADRAQLETYFCAGATTEPVTREVRPEDRDGIHNMFPEQYRSAADEQNIIDDYEIYLSCYIVDPDLAPRPALYATLIYNPDTFPLRWNLRRAARVANIIGTDGGILMGEDTTLHGTQGAWEVACDSVMDCANKNTTFVVTTGMDIYLPELEQTPDNTVDIPDRLALSELHAMNYFSVGTMGKQCAEILHTRTEDRLVSESDIIHRTGTAIDDGKCDPLFWVGTASGTGNDNSQANHVYVRNNLYVGRDNDNDRQAVAIETDDSDNANRRITVYDTSGAERLTLDGNGRLIGRTTADGSGYVLDAQNGEMILFKEASINLDGVETKVQVATTRIKDGVLTTGKQTTYNDENGNSHTEYYRLDPAYTSLMNDIRLTSRGGARLSDILPNYIAKGMTAITGSGPVAKPTCPNGYAQAIMVTPTTFDHRIQNMSLSIHLKTAENVIPDGETKPRQLNVSFDSPNADDEGGLTFGGANTNIKVWQHEPVNIRITSGSDDPQWNVELAYGEDNAADNSIQAIAQTYCVYNTTETSEHGLNTTASADRTSATDSATRPCANDYECMNTESCQASVSGGQKTCQTLGACSGTDGSNAGTNTYCIDGQQVYIECTADKDGKICVNNRWK